MRYIENTRSIRRISAKLPKMIKAKVMKTAEQRMRILRPARSTRGKERRVP